MKTNLPISTWEAPLANIRGWRFFMDQDEFIPSDDNPAQVARCFAWHPHVKRYYCCVLGVDRPFQYQKGASFPVDVSACRITDGSTQEEIAHEYCKAMRDLIAAVMAEERL